MKVKVFYWPHNYQTEAEQLVQFPAIKFLKDLTITG